MAFERVDENVRTRRGGDVRSRSLVRYRSKCEGEGRIMRSRSYGERESESAVKRREEDGQGRNEGGGENIMKGGGQEKEEEEVLMVVKLVRRLPLNKCDRARNSSLSLSPSLFRLNTYIQGVSGGLIKILGPDCIVFFFK